MQVEVLKNNYQEIKLVALLLEDGKVKTIVLALINLLNEFDIWEVIKVIICNTANTNTEAKSDVVVYLKKVYNQEIRSSTIYWLPAHVLDLLLKHVMDEIFGGKTWSPIINYVFVDELIKNYDDMVKNFKQSTSNISISAMVWQDDMKFV